MSSLVAAAAALLAAPPAGVAAPVENGLIAYTTNVAEAGEPSRGGVRLLKRDGYDRVVIADPAVNVLDVEWSPDGRSLAFVHGYHDGGPRTLYVADGEGGNRRAVLTGPSLASPTWSPDGSRIAVTTGNSAISAVPAAGGAVETLYVSPGAQWLGDISWSPDGQRMLLVDSAVAHPMGIDVLELATGEVTELAAPPQHPEDEYFHSAPTWSPDGTTVLFVRRVDLLYSPPDRTWLMLVDADGANVREFSETGFFEPAPRWSPDGREIVQRVGHRGGGGGLVILDIATRLAVRSFPFHGGDPNRTSELSWQALPPARAPVVPDQEAEGTDQEPEGDPVVTDSAPPLPPGPAPAPRPAPQITPLPARPGTGSAKLRPGLLRGARMRMRCGDSGVLSARLTRNGRTVARGHRRVRRGICSLTLSSRNGLRPGRYLLVVRLKTATGTTTMRIRVRVRAPRAAS